MLKIVAPALALVAAICFIKMRGNKDEAPYEASESERLTEMAAGAYPGE